MYPFPININDWLPGDSQNSTVNKLWPAIQSFDWWKWLQSHKATWPFGWLLVFVYVITRRIPCFFQKLCLVTKGSCSCSFDIFGNPYLSAKYGPNEIGRNINCKLSLPVRLSCPYFDKCIIVFPNECSPPTLFNAYESRRALVSWRSSFLFCCTPTICKSSWFL